MALLWAAMVFTLLPLPGPAAEEPPPGSWETGVIPQHSTLQKALFAKGMSSQRIHRIASLLAPHVDLRKIRPDSAFRYSLDGDGELEEFLLDVDGGKICRLVRTPSGRYTVTVKPGKRRLEPSLVSGEVSTTLEEALKQAGEARGLAVLFREILDDRIGSTPELAKGDQFKLVVDKIYVEDKVLRYGEIHGFVIRNRQTVVRAFRYEGNFYDENGISLQQAFLRVPLDYHYVSCEFMQRRKHPILGGVRPHHGIDFVAPFGTPVWAIADGKVVFCGWRGGYGYTVVLQHRHGYETLYGHLQRFGSGIREGAKVRKKQVIGYIGATGLATGPHLHFGLTRNGKNRNPLLERYPREKITEARDREPFLEKKGTMLAIMGEGGS